MNVGGLEDWGVSVLIFLIESFTWKLSFGGLEARQASAFIFLIESLTWELRFGALGPPCCLGTMYAPWASVPLGVPLG